MNHGRFVGAVIEVNATESRARTRALPRNERTRVTTLPPPPPHPTTEMDRVSLAAYEMVALRADLAHVTAERDYYRRHLEQMREFIDQMLALGPRCGALPR